MDWPNRNWAGKSSLTIPEENTHDVSLSQGFAGHAENYGTGDIDMILMGLEGWAYNAGDAHIGNVSGAYAWSESDAGTVDILSGLNVGTWAIGGTATDVYGIKYEDVGVDEATVTNRYGLYMPAFTGTVANDYGIYVEGLQDNYFAGNVGIGTDTPTEALEVNGNIRITAGSGGELIFSDGTGMTTAAATATGMTSTTDLNFAADSDVNGSGVINLSTNGENRLTISNDGNVGIGTTNPIQSNLQIGGYGVNAFTDPSGFNSLWEQSFVTYNSQDGMTAGGIDTDFGVGGSSDVANVIGFSSNPYYQGSGTVTNLIDYYSSGYVVSGTVTNQYGIKVEDKTGGINNWNIWSGPDMSDLNTAIQTDWGGNYTDGNVFTSVDSPSGYPFVVINQGVGTSSFYTYSDDDHSQMQAGEFQAVANGDDHIGQAIGLRTFTGAVNSSIIDEGIGLLISNPTLLNSAAITENFGIKIEDQVSGDNNYNIWSGPTDVPSEFGTYITRSQNVFNETYSAAKENGLSTNINNSSGVGGVERGAYVSASTTDTGGGSYVMGLEGNGYHYGSGDITSMLAGTAGYIEIGTEGTVDRASALWSEGAYVSGGTVDNLYGLLLDPSFIDDSATVTNNYGIKVDDQADGTNNWNIWSGPSAVVYDKYDLTTSSPNVFNTEWTAEHNYGLSSIFNINDDATADEGYGLYAQSVVTTNNNESFAQGLEADAIHHGTGTVGSLYGVQGVIEVDNGGTATKTYGLLTGAGSAIGAGSVIDTGYGLMVSNGGVSGGGVINNLYGIQVNDQTVGTRNWNIWSGSDYSLFSAGEKSSFLNVGKNIFAQKDPASNSNPLTVVNDSSNGNLYSISTLTRATAGATNNYGSNFLSDNNGATLTDMAALLLNVNSLAGTATNGYGLIIGGPTVSGGSITNEYGLKIEDQNTGTNNYGIYTDSTAGANNYALYNAGTAKSYFAGSVGIGTSAPATNLEISSAAAPTLRLRSTAVDDDQPRIEIWSDYNNAAERNWVMTNGLDQFGQLTFAVSNAKGGDPYNAGTSIMSLNKGGFVGIGNTSPSVALDITGDIEYTGTITDVSDERLKENITDFDSGLDIVNSIGVKNFNMIGKDKLETGFIAQNVKEFWPEGVSVIDPENGYMGVSYVSFIPILTRAVQELSQKIDNVKDDLVLWFADAGNGITEMFANTFRAKEKLCINDTCVTEAELQALIENANGSSGSGSGDEEETTPPSDEEVTTPPPAPDSSTPPSDEVTPQEGNEVTPPTEDTPQDTTPIDVVE